MTNQTSQVQQFQQLLETAKNSAQVLAEFCLEQAAQLDRRGQKQLAAALRDRTQICYRNITTCLGKIQVQDDTQAGAESTATNDVSRDI